MYKYFFKFNFYPIEFYEKINNDYFENKNIYAYKCFDEMNQ